MTLRSIGTLTDVNGIMCGGVIRRMKYDHSRLTIKIRFQGHYYDLYVISTKGGPIKFVSRNNKVHYLELSN